MSRDKEYNLVVSLKDNASRQAKILEKNLSKFNRSYDARINVSMIDNVSNKLNNIFNSLSRKNKGLDVGISAASLARINKFQKTYSNLFLGGESKKWYDKVFGYLGALIKKAEKFGLVLAGAFTAVGVVTIAAMGVAMAGLGKKIVTVNSQMEQFEVSLQTTLGTLAAAKEEMSGIVKFAKETPYTIAQVTNAVVKLRAYAMDSGKWLKPLGDMASAFGRDITDAVEAAADATMGMFRRALSYGIRMERADFKKGGKYAGMEYGDAFLLEVNKRFKGGMKLQAQTLAGIWSNIKDTMTIAFQKATAPLYGIIKNVVSKVYDSINNDAFTTRMGEVFKDMTVGIGKAMLKLQSMSAYFQANIAPMFSQLSKAGIKTLISVLTILSALLSNFLAPLLPIFSKLIEWVSTLVIKFQWVLKWLIALKVGVAIWGMLTKGIWAAGVQMVATGQRANVLSTQMELLYKRLLKIGVVLLSMWAVSQWVEINNGLKEIGKSFEKVAGGVGKTKEYLKNLGKQSGQTLASMVKAAQAAKDFGVNAPNALLSGAEAAKILGLSAEDAVRQVGDLAKVMILTSDNAVTMAQKTREAATVLAYFAEHGAEAGIVYENAVQSMMAYPDVIKKSEKNMNGLVAAMMAFSRATDGADLSGFLSQIESLVNPSEQMLKTLDPSIWLSKTTSALVAMGGDMRDSGQAIIDVMQANKIMGKSFLDSAGNINKFDYEIKDVAAAIISLSAKQKQAAANSKFWGDKVADLTIELTRLQGWITTIDLQLDDLNKEMAEAGAVLNLAMANIELKKFDAAATKTKESIASMNANIAAQEAALAGLKNKLSTVSNTFQDISDKIQDAQERLDKFTHPKLEGMGAFDDKIHDIDMKLNSLNREKLDVTARLRIFEEAGLTNTDAYRMAAAPLQALEDQIAILQNSRDKLELDRSIAYDDQLYQLDKIADRTKEITFNEAITGANKAAKELDKLEPKLKVIEAQKKNLERQVELRQNSIDAQKAIVEQVEAEIDAQKLVIQNELDRIDLLKQVADSEALITSYKYTQAKIDAAKGIISPTDLQMIEDQYMNAAKKAAALNEDKGMYERQVNRTNAQISTYTGLQNEQTAISDALLGDIKTLSTNAANLVEGINFEALINSPKNALTEVFGENNMNVFTDMRGYLQTIADKDFTPPNADNLGIIGNAKNFLGTGTGLATLFGVLAAIKGVKIGLKLLGKESSLTAYTFKKVGKAVQASMLKHPFRPTKINVPSANVMTRAEFLTATTNARAAKTTAETLRAGKLMTTQEFMARTDAALNPVKAPSRLSRVKGKTIDIAGRFASTRGSGAILRGYPKDIGNRIEVARLVLAKEVAEQEAMLRSMLGTKADIPIAKLQTRLANKNKELDALRKALSDRRLSNSMTTILDEVVDLTKDIGNSVEKGTKAAKKAAKASGKKLSTGRKLAAGGLITSAFGIESWKNLYRGLSGAAKNPITNLRSILTSSSAILGDYSDQPGKRINSRVFGRFMAKIGFSKVRRLGLEDRVPVKTDSLKLALRNLSGVRDKSNRYVEGFLPTNFAMKAADQYVNPDGKDWYASEFEKRNWNPDDFQSLRENQIEALQQGRGYKTGRIGSRRGVVALRNVSTVESLRQAMTDNAIRTGEAFSNIPPIEMTLDRKGRLIIQDGHHRLIASFKNRLAEVKVRIHTGPLIDDVEPLIDQVTKRFPRAWEIPKTGRAKRLAEGLESMFNPANRLGISNISGLKGAKENTALTNEIKRLASQYDPRLNPWTKYSRFMPIEIQQQLYEAGAKPTKEFDRFVARANKQGGVGFRQSKDSGSWFDLKKRKIELPSIGDLAVGTDKGLAAFFHELGHATQTTTKAKRGSGARAMIDLLIKRQYTGKTNAVTQKVLALSEAGAWNRALRMLQTTGVDVTNDAKYLQVAYDTLKTYLGEDHAAVEIDKIMDALGRNKEKLDNIAKLSNTTISKTIPVAIKEMNNVASTSRNQLPGGFKKVASLAGWTSGTTNLDIGGGKYGKGTAFLQGKGVENLIDDTFNRTIEQQRLMAKRLSEIGKVNTATVFNVLNVIEDTNTRLSVISKAKNNLVEGGKAYFTAWAGEGVDKGTGAARVGIKTKQFQAYKNIAEYIPEIEKVFGKGNVLLDSKTGVITAINKLGEVSQKALPKVSKLTKFASGNFGKTLKGGAKLGMLAGLGDLSVLQKPLIKGLEKAGLGKVATSTLSKIFGKALLGGGPIGWAALGVDVVNLLKSDFMNEKVWKKAFGGKTIQEFAKDNPVSRYMYGAFGKENVQKIFKPVGNVWDAATHASGLLTDVFSGTTGLFKGVFTGDWSSLGSAVKSFGENTIGMLQDVGKTAENIVKAIPNVAKAVGSGIKNFFTKDLTIASIDYQKIYDKYAIVSDKFATKIVATQKVIDSLSLIPPTAGKGRQITDEAIKNSQLYLDTQLKNIQVTQQEIDAAYKELTSMQGPTVYYSDVEKFAKNKKIASSVKSSQATDIVKNFLNPQKYITELQKSITPLISTYKGFQTATYTPTLLQFQVDLENAARAREGLPLLSTLTEQQKQLTIALENGASDWGTLLRTVDTTAPKIRDAFKDANIFKLWKLEAADIKEYYESGKAASDAYYKAWSEQNKEVWGPMWAEQAKLIQDSLSNIKVDASQWITAGLAGKGTNSLAQGQSNLMVAQLQYKLNTFYGSGLEVDSVMGKKTKAALQQAYDYLDYMKKVAPAGEGEGFFTAQMQQDLSLFASYINTSAENAVNWGEAYAKGGAATVIAAANAAKEVRDKNKEMDDSTKAMAAGWKAHFVGMEIATGISLANINKSLDSGIGVAAKISTTPYYTLGKNAIASLGAGIGYSVPSPSAAGIGASRAGGVGSSNLPDLSKMSGGPGAFMQNVISDIFNKSSNIGNYIQTMPNFPVNIGNVNKNKTYEPGHLQPEAGMVIEALKNAFGAISYGGRAGRSGSYVSQHPVGLAADLFANKPKMDQYANWLAANFSALKLKYIIWNNRITSSGSRGWRAYSPPAGKPNTPTWRHEDHVHVSVNDWIPGDPYSSSHGASKYHTGGITPGTRFQESLALLRGQEAIVPLSNGAIPVKLGTSKVNTVTVNNNFAKDSMNFVVRDDNDIEEIKEFLLKYLTNNQNVFKVSPFNL